MESDAQPRFYHPRPVPHALRQKVEAEIRRLEKEGVMESVKFSEWAAPIVPVVKSDGSIRICGDFKLTVNQVAKSDSFPLPRIEDLFSTLAGGQAFTKLDLAHAISRCHWRRAQGNTSRSTPLRGCSVTTGCRLAWRRTSNFPEDHGEPSPGGSSGDGVYRQHLDHREVRGGTSTLPGRSPAASQRCRHAVEKVQVLFFAPGGGVLGTSDLE